MAKGQGIRLRDTELPGARACSRRGFRQTEAVWLKCLRPTGREAATDYYQIWFNLKNPKGVAEFFGQARGYLGALKDKGVIEGWQAFQRSGGRASRGETAFNVTLAVNDLEKFGEDFRLAASGDPALENMHNGVVSLVKDVQLALFRDLVDTLRGDVE